MDKKYTSVEEQVEYGLDTIAPDRMIEVPLRDLMFVYQTLYLFINFFHNPSHYPDIEAIYRFLGNKEAGAFHLLCEGYYDKLRGGWPKDIVESFDGDRFDNPDPPYFYQPAEPETT